MKIIKKTILLYLLFLLITVIDSKASDFQVLSPWVRSGTNVYLGVVPSFVSIGAEPAELSTFEVHGANGAVGSSAVFTHRDPAPGNSLFFYRSRGTMAAPTAITTNTYLGNIVFGGWDGANYSTGLTYIAIATENWTTTARGTKYSLSLTANGAAAVTERMTWDQNGNIGISQPSPTASLHIRAGTAAAGTAPLKFTAGTNLTTPEDGAVEYDGTNLFYTNSTPTRNTLASVLSATSASIGGGALLAGACANTTTAVTGAATTMAVIITPTTYPGDGNFWHGYVSAANNVTVSVCASVAGTPTASTYIIRVIK